MITDITDKPIEIGDIVAFAKSSGGITELVLRRVTDIGEWELEIEPVYGGRRGWTYPNRVIVVNYQVGSY